ncbi:hypothetical protein ACFOD4_18905 [Pseudoroseomonas globiformis]|uniref:Uncharacterized protein n=1 Tax=Teichococcus globiformis TaxID=2307229 RepID=A0ABV7G360_9PROT
MTPEDHRLIAEAAELAEELAPDLRVVLLTHYPDADTLDLMRPGGQTLEAVRAANRAVAAALLRHGVTVLVQQADKAAFRRWMQDRSATAESRLGWRGRTPVARGEEAIRLLEIDPASLPVPQREKASGTPADRLMRLFAGPDGTAFDSLAETLIASGRDGVLEQAVRRVAQRHGEEAAEDLTKDLLAMAEAGPAGPSGWSELVALPVGLSPGPLPEPAALAQSLAASGALSEGLELQLLPQWFSPDAVASLTPGQLRQTLIQMAEGQQPQSLPPADESTLAEGGFGVLIGLQLDWTVPLWEEIAARGLPEPPEEGQETPEEKVLADAFERWRSMVFRTQGGCVPLALVPLSETEAEIAAFLEEAEEQTGAWPEIQDLVEMARQEAGDQEVVCLPRVEGDQLHLALYTRRGRLLDEMTLEGERLPVPASEMPSLLETIVSLVDSRPQ